MVDRARVWNKNTKGIPVVIGVLRSIPHLTKKTSQEYWHYS